MSEENKKSRIYKELVLFTNFLDFDDDGEGEDVLSSFLPWKL